MDNAFSQGRPFEFGDIWQADSFSLDEDPTVFFRPQLLAPKEFVFDNESRLQLPDLALPDITELNFDVSESSGDSNGNLSPVVLPTLVDASHHENDGDLWTLNLDLGGQPPAPQVHTWESFERKSVTGVFKTPYLSEAGPGAFSAAIATGADSSQSTGVLPQPAILRGLSILVLGRSSSLFQWDAKESTFVPTLPDVPICGPSASTSKSVILRMTTMGNLYRKLDDFACPNNRLKGFCPAAIALRSCIADVMAGIETKLSSKTARCRSMLQLQRLVDRPFELLKIMNNLVDCATTCESEEHMISSISEAVENSLTVGGQFTALLESALARICTPWLECLLVDMGMQVKMPSATISESLTANAMTGSFDSRSSRQPPGSEGMPAFVTAEDCALVDATKESMDMVRKYLPHQRHALQGVALPLDKSRDLSMESATIPGQADAEEVAYRSSGEDLAWSDEGTQQHMFAVLDAQMSGAMESTANPDNSLRNALHRWLDETVPVQRSYDITSGFSLNPLDRLRPSILTHQQILNTALLRHMLFELQLRHHLDLQRQFHLLGNGDFITRLSQALFSSNTQTAQRRRGVMPTSEVVGLRLDRRDGQTWPPASSELGLTLMGVLTETYASQSRGRPRREDQTLPGGLSFSVRELPEDEIDRVMDPDSIYALDFLRLKYTAPPCLDVVFTTSTMQIYDDIFKFLLRLLRVRHVVSKLREHLMFQRRAQRRPINEAKDCSRIQFAMEAYATLTVLTSHFMDIGIDSSWQILDSTLCKIQRDLSNDVSTSRGAAVGLDDLRRTHEEYLERIRSRLFLRRKHEKLRLALENVLTSTLGCGSNMEKEGAITDTGLFRHSLTELFDTLRSAIDRASAGTKASAADDGDTEAMKILLTKLRWNQEESGKTAL